MQGMRTLYTETLSAAWPTGRYLGVTGKWLRAKAAVFHTYAQMIGCCPMSTWLDVSYSNGRVSGMEGETTSDRLSEPNRTKDDQFSFKKGMTMTEKTKKTNKPDAPVHKLAWRQKEVAQALSLSERKVEELKAGNHIPHFHVGKAVLYPVDQMRQWVEEQTKSKGSKR